MRRRVRHPKINLNNEQKEVVNHNEGALLVSAGPGSGKTRSIVERIARLIKQGVVKPHRILATTFTKKAAAEMNERLEAKRINTTTMSVQTTHSFVWKICKRHKHYKTWALDENNDGEIILKDIIGYKGINWKGCDLSKVEDFIAHCRNSLIPPEECVKFLQGPFADKRFEKVYTDYDDEMRARKLVTFDDMLYYGVRLIQYDPLVQRKIQNQYQYVMVDELQDSNIAQTILAELVAAPEFNLMGVGDIDQAIYQFRGAIPQYMLDFADKYNAKVISLGINYRCAPSIVEASAACIKYNEARIDKPLTAHRKYEMKIIHQEVRDTDEEAEIIREQIQELNSDGMSHGNMIVLMRTNSQSRAIEEEFIASKIPFIVLGTISFYERKEIVDILSYLRLIINRNDVRAGRRAINKPFRHVGKNTLDVIDNRAHRIGNYIDAIKEWLDKDGYSNFTLMKKLEDFIALIEDYEPHESPAGVIKDIVDRSHYIEYLQENEGSDTIESSRAMNIGELISSASRFTSIAGFIEHVDLQIKLRRRNQKKEDDHRVQVMTIHKSKGIESPCVFIIGANEGLLPHAKGDEEEERRLWYVAMTRAKNYLHVSSIQNVTDGTRSLSVSPSRFLNESGIPLTSTEPSTTVAESGASSESECNLREGPRENI